MAVGVQHLARHQQPPSSVLWPDGDESRRADGTILSPHSVPSSPAKVRVNSSFGLDCALANLTAALPARGLSSLTVVLAPPAGAVFVRTAEHAVSRALDLTIIGAAAAAPRAAAMAALSSSSAWEVAQGADRPVVSGGGTTRLFSLTKGARLSLAPSCTTRRRRGRLPLLC